MFLDSGELFLNTKNQGRPSKTLVFFVHFLGGHKKVLKRHVELVRNWGYDCYVFNLKDSYKEYSFLPYSSASKRFGLKHAMTDEIEKHFNQFDDYSEKIIFSFSNISGCCIEMLERRFTKNQNDVKALICDSGPGLEFFRSSNNLIKYQFKITSLIPRLLLTPLIAFGWSLQLNRDVIKHLKKFPKGFPILSIRGRRDLLISPKSIDDIFRSQTHLKLSVLELPQAGHINGLRDFPSEYIGPVEQFFIDVQLQ